MAEFKANPDLPALLFRILQRHPGGLSEYELLRELQTTPECAFNPTGLHKDLALFQAHFLLFNALYRLRERLSATGAYGLEIHVLRIALTPGLDASADSGQLASSNQALGAYDPLREYYLDIDQLTNTDANDVARLLGDFWMRYLALESRAAALAELGLSEPTDLNTIRRRYRELAMRLHPDRGGDPEAFRRLVSARRVLEQTQPHCAPHITSKRPS